MFTRAANLNINYRLPTRADQFVAIYTKLVEKKGRKVVVNAEMKNLAGETLADAQCVPFPATSTPPSSDFGPDTCDVRFLAGFLRAVYVEPKWASMLDNSGVRELLGHRGARYEPPPLVSERERKVQNSQVLA